MSVTEAYRCPKGHLVKRGGHNDPDLGADSIICEPCGLIATHLNASEVFTWTPLHDHYRACERLQDEMDEAFDNQHFSGGW